MEYRTDHGLLGSMTICFIEAANINSRNALRFVHASIITLVLYCTLHTVEEYNQKLRLFEVNISSKA